MMNCIQIINLTLILHIDTIKLCAIQYFKIRLTWDCGNNLCFNMGFLLMHKEKGDAMTEKGANRRYYKCTME